MRLGGQTAGGIDFAEVIGRRLPWFVGSVLAVSFLLLGVFRSVLVPLKAVLRTCSRSARPTGCC